MRIAGAVLAGGASRRMGRTKALVEVDGTAMGRRVIDALTGAGCVEVVLVGGSATELAPLGAPVVTDRHPGQGPLGGVITALEHFATSSHVIVAACDLPLLDVGSVRTLLDAARRAPECAVVVATNSATNTVDSGRIEPALAVWNRSSLDALVTWFAGGERALHRVLDLLDTQAVPIDPGALVNANRPDDVPRADVPGSSGTDQ